MYYTEEIKTIKEALKDFSVRYCLSETSFGVSFYIYANDVKIRVSDHSVTNIFRLKYEEHYSFSCISFAINELKLRVERILHPERFEKVVSTKEVLVSSNVVLKKESYKSHFEKHHANCEITNLEFFTNKRGVEKVKVFFNTTKTEEVLTFVRK